MKELIHKTFSVARFSSLSLLFLFGILLTAQNAQSQIASEGLNNSAGIFTFGGVGAYYTGNSATGDSPASTPFFVEGTHSRGTSNGSGTLTTSSMNSSGYTGVALSFRLASFSIASTGNGADGTDIVTVEVSPDGGTTYYSTVRVLGNTNARWSFTSGTGTASTAYDGNATPIDFTPAGGGARTTDGYSTVTVTGLPAVAALRVRITLLNNDTSERWLVDNFTVTGTAATGPEINLQGNSVSIVSGDSTPDVADHTDFGSVLASSGTLTRTFTIQNTGTTSLTVGAISFSGAAAADYSVTTAPSASVAAAGSTTFVVTFDPSAVGARNATISIVNNDSDENPYTFALTGTGLADPAPILAVSGTPTNHGSVCPNVAATTRQYTITNTGTVTATGVTVVSSDPQFAVSGLSSTTIASGGGTATYNVTFTPTSAGAKSATITVASTTSGSNSPTSSLTGTGTTAATAAVTTSAATAVATATATLNGNVTTLGVCPSSTFKGFVYALTATNATPTIGGTGVTATTPAAASAGTFNAALTGLATGSSYSFRAYIYDGTTYTYGSVLTFNTLSPPANDECVGAVALTLGAAAISGNTANATQSLAGCVGNANDDVWYSFTTTVAGTYTITVVGSSSFDAVVGVRSGACPGTNIFCTDDSASGGTETVSATGLAASTTYLVRVYDFNTAPATTTFTIRVTAPPATLSTNGTATLTFANSNVLTATASQTFNLSGAALTGGPGDITVSAPNANFEVSSNNSTWGATATIPYTTSTLASTPVYVRFVPQSSGAKTGNITFSGGGVATPPTIAVTGTGILLAPTASPATNLTTTSFDANWTAVPGATGYLLDVSTSATFGTSAPAAVTESFETGLTGSYQTGNVTLGTGVWAVTNVLKGTTGVNSGTGSAQLQSATGSALVSPSFDSISTINFYVTSSVAGGAVQVNYSTDGGTTWTPAPGSPFTGIGTTKVLRSVTLNSTNNDIKLQFVRTAGTIYIDDITINYTATVPSFFSTFNAFNVGNVTTYTVSGITSGTTYYYRVRATDGAPSPYSGTVTVAPISIGGTAVSSQTLCSGSTPADLTLSGNTGNVIRWERASDAAFTTPVTIADTTTTLAGATIGALTATTYFRAVVQSGSNPIAYSTIVTITVDPVSVGGTVAGSTSVCSVANSGSLTLTGYTGTITKWQSADDEAFTVNVLDIPNASDTLGYTNLVQTTYYRAVVTSGACSLANSSVATITVDSAANGGSIVGDTSACSGNNSGSVTVSGYSGTITGWQSSLDNFATTVTPINNTTATQSYNNITVTTYYRAVLSGGACGSIFSPVATITVSTVNVWTGNSNTTWADGSNWSCGIVPTAVTDVQIAATPNQPVISSNITIHSLTMVSGTALVVPTGFNLTVTDAVVTLGTASLTVQSDANLLQANDVDNTGVITVERDSNPLMRLDYTLWSSPVDDQNLLDFSSATVATRFYVYNPATDVYNSVVPSTTDFAEGTGYLIRMPDNHPTTPTVWSGSFTGGPHNGDVDLTVTTGTYNAIGNPYPSTIDADAFINENNLNEALYFWRKTNNTATTSYATYTLAGGAGTNPNAGDPLGLIPNGIIQVGQGFIAKSTSTTLSFNNAMRIADNDGQFFRTNQLERNRIWLNLTNNDGIFSQTMVAYMTGATQGVDAKIDGLFFNDSQVALTSVIEGSEYAVQGRALPFDMTDVVPLGFKAITAGNYTIGLDHADGLFEDGTQDIYLKDNADNSTHDLRESNYTFATEAGTFNNRFEIVYQSTLGISNPTLTANQVVVYKQGQDLVVNSGKTMMATVKVFDIRGRLLAEKENVNASEVKIFAGSTNQVLIVKVIAQDGKEVSKKVIN